MTGLSQLLLHPIRTLRAPPVRAVGGDVIAVLDHHQFDWPFGFARQAFNDSVMTFNTAVEQFPSNVIANFFAFKQAELLQATEAQEKAWTAFAAKRESGDFQALRAAYNAVADAWANAQLIKTGPVTLFLRYDRFAYWPEARNATQRALDQLLAAKNPKDLTPESLAHDSVAGQGLTALSLMRHQIRQWPPKIPSTTLFMAPTLSIRRPSLASQRFRD